MTNREGGMRGFMARECEILSHIRYEWRSDVVQKDGAYLRELAEKLEMASEEAATKLLEHYKQGGNQHD